MRALKTLLFVVLALVAIGGIFYALGKPSYRVERSVTINAPADVVYQQISSFAAMDKWSPWNEKDPAMKKSIEGTDGTVGAKSLWEGNSAVGKGSQEMVAMEPNKKVSMKVAFVEPFESMSNADVELAADGEGTKASWIMYGNNDGIMSRVGSMFFNMDKEVGADFEKGLALLKAQAEKAHAEKPVVKALPAIGEVTVADRAEGYYVGIKSDPKLPQADAEKFFKENTPKLYEAVGKAGVKPEGPMCGLFYDWDMEHHTTSVMVCLPVGAKSKVPGLASEQVSAGKAYSTVMRGGYANGMAAHNAVQQRVTADNMDMGLVLEEYAVNQGMEPDSSKWVTNIVYMAKAKK
jgi:uncharacterized protein YndB with AHSA1/START domain